MKKEIARDESTSLREEGIRPIDRIAIKGTWSRLIHSAMRRCRAVIGRQKPSEQVKAGAVRRAQRDLSMADEWFPIEEEAYRISKGNPKRGRC